MVSTVTPNGGPNGGLSVQVSNLEARAPRTQLSLPQKPLGDAASSSISDTQAAWRAARQSVDQGLDALDLALGAGRDALALLNRIGEKARAGEDAQDDIAAYDTLLRTSGAGLLLGEDLIVSAEPGGAAIVIAGLDARAGAAVSLPAQGAEADLARAAQDGAVLLQAHLTRLEGAARGLDSHAGLLAAAERGASGVRLDVDADAARLMALQVRQGLEAGGAIISAEPQAVLSLFRD